MLTDRVDRDDVGMLKARDDARFAAESLALVVGVGAEDLERDLPPQTRVHGEVHGAHAALSEHPSDLVVTDVGGQRAHGGDDGATDRPMEG